jgi:5-methyltetrahydropteroyltriglutamate--homocysteine methyltransferase
VEAEIGFCLFGPLIVLWVPKTLCHQVTFMNHASGAVAPPDTETVQAGNAIRRRAQRRGPVQGAVRPVREFRIPRKPLSRAVMALRASRFRWPMAVLLPCSYRRLRLALWLEADLTRIVMRENRPEEAMFDTTIAGSLPKPTWLAEPDRLWAPWRLTGAELEGAKRDATLLALKLQEDCGIDVVTDGEQSRQHFVHGFVEFVDGIDFAHKVEIGIRADRYKALVPQVTGELGLKGRVHATEAQLARAHTRRKLKITLPGPMTIVDTVADAHYGDRVKMAMAFAGLLNAEARALAADGVDVIQFDEPAFNVYMAAVKDWGIEALHRAIEGVGCTTAVHICYGYGIKANIDWKATLGGEWRQYAEIFPALAQSRISQVSVECRNSHVPMSLLKLLDGKDVQVGVIDVATDEVETPEQVAAVIGEAMKYVPRERIIASTNCGMAPIRRDVAYGKLAALAQGAALARKRFG